MEDLQMHHGMTKKFTEWNESNKSLQDRNIQTSQGALQVEKDTIEMSIQVSS